MSPGGKNDEYFSASFEFDRTLRHLEEISSNPNLLPLLREKVTWKGSNCSNCSSSDSYLTARSVQLCDSSARSMPDIGPNMDTNDDDDDDEVNDDDDNIQLFFAARSVGFERCNPHPPPPQIDSDYEEHEEEENYEAIFEALRDDTADDDGIKSFSRIDDDNNRLPRRRRQEHEGNVECHGREFARLWQERRWRRRTSSVDEAEVRRFLEKRSSNRYRTQGGGDIEEKTVMI